MNSDLRDAIFQKLAFKPAEMKTYQAAVIYSALAVHPLEFAADDVPAALRPATSTTAGRNCAWINTYRLASVALALAWLERNGFTPLDAAMKQGELIGRSSASFVES